MNALLKRRLNGPADTIKVESRALRAKGKMGRHVSGWSSIGKQILNSGMLFIAVIWQLAKRPVSPGMHIFATIIMKTYKKTLTIYFMDKIISCRINLDGDVEVLFNL